MNKTIIIDDTWHYIEIIEGGEEFKILHIHEFNECLDILLTDNQLEKKIGDNTTNFKVSDKRIEAFKSYINDYENNIWRKQSLWKL